jgi:prevent-host-death family protein
MVAEATMETIGIRELKTHLSRHLKRVRTGVRLVVTEHGRSIATISPIDSSPSLDWARQLVAEGGAQWNGGKPVPVARPVLTSGRSASAIVVEDRR